MMSPFGVIATLQRMSQPPVCILRAKSSTVMLHGFVARGAPAVRRFHVDDVDAAVLVVHDQRVLTAHLRPRGALITVAIALVSLVMLQSLSLRRTDGCSSGKSHVSDRPNV